MKYLKLLSLLYFTFLSLTALAEYEYELIEEDRHKIHVIVIDPNEYEVSLVAAHDQVFGREKVGDIAKRRNSQIAVNAGFFQIGENQDGRPTGTLVSDGQVFGMRVSKHGCFIKTGDKFSVEMVTPFLEVTAGDEVIRPKKYNRSAKGRDVFFFNSKWGPSTLSDYNNRKEVIIDRNLKVIKIAKHGGNEIPAGGYVLSFPVNHDLSYITTGQKLKFSWHPGYLAEKNGFAVMGLPVLIMDDKIADNLPNKEHHARTAVGTNKDGNLVLVVAEHVYKKNITEIGISDIKKVIENKNLSLDNLKASDVKKILLEDLSSDSPVIGLTIAELARFMKEKGCIAAINLDGGGSSTMYIEGKYVNQSFGDIDEAEGLKIVRPVSDALVFKKKIK
ncbi:MAG: hypothetical protein Tsb006_8050 [Rickettsiaceae bacterium]